MATKTLYHTVPTVLPSQAWSESESSKSIATYQTLQLQDVESLAFLIPRKGYDLLNSFAFFDPDCGGFEILGAEAASEFRFGRV